MYWESRLTAPAPGVSQYREVPFENRAWPLEPNAPLAIIVLTAIAVLLSVVFTELLPILIVLTERDVRFAPTSKATVPLDENNFSSVRLTANSPAAI